MNPLDILDEASNEVSVFDSHPACNLSMEQRLLYLQVLSMVMNADGEVCGNEKNYLLRVTRSLEIDKSYIDELVDFSKAPDKDTIKDFLVAFRNHQLSPTFLMDGWMLACADGVENEKEVLLLCKLADQMGVSRATRDSIRAVANYLTLRDIPDAILYSSIELPEEELFTHLLTGRDYGGLYVDIELMRRTRLLESISTRTWQLLPGVKWAPVQHVDAVMTAGCLPPIEFSKVLTMDLLLPHLQAMLNRDQLVVAADDVYCKKGKKQEFYFSLSELGLAYDKKASVFSLPEKSAKKKAPELPNAVINDFLGAVSGLELDITSISGNMVIFLVDLFFDALPLSQPCAKGDIYVDDDMVLWATRIKKTGKSMGQHVSMSFSDVIESGLLRLIRMNKRSRLDNFPLPVSRKSRAKKTHPKGLLDDDKSIFSSTVSIAKKSAIMASWFK
jgi:uncharacterized tellurite resistance protein B-like protein